MNTAAFPLKVKIQRIEDTEPIDMMQFADPSNYMRIDQERLDAYNNGTWSMIGIRAECEIVVNGTVQTITSGGLWGIESDADEAYLNLIETEQLDELTGILRELGVITQDAPMA